MARIQVLDHDDLAPGDITPGMHRRGGTLGEQLRALEVRTEPGMVSGWHHHGAHDTVGWVRAGRLRLEFGPNGSDVVEIGPGGFFRVPAQTIHRESNPGDEEQVLIGFRRGTGATVVNVDGPAQE